jgi:hypothetical protein
MARVSEESSETVVREPTEEECDRMAEEIEREHREFEESPTRPLNVDLDAKLWDAVWERAERDDCRSDEVMIAALERYLRH